MKISIEKILQNIPNNLSEIEKVRYIYLELGRIVAYDKRYINTKEPEYERDAYNKILTPKVIENSNYENKILVLCKQIAEMLRDTINMLNDENVMAITEGHYDNMQKHVGTIVSIGNERYWLDLTFDLYRIQNGLKTHYFATYKESREGIPCTTISEDELKLIDEKLGYCKNGMYMDDVVEMIRKEMQNETRFAEYLKEQGLNPEFGRRTKEENIFKFKIDFIAKYMKNNILSEEEIGISEIEKYHRYLIKTLLTDDEKEKHKLKEYWVFEKDEETGVYEDNYFIELTMEYENIYYIYDKKEKRLIEIKMEQLKEMKQNRKIKYVDPNNNPEDNYDAKKERLDRMQLGRSEFSNERQNSGDDR